ncbi:hypothetical protein [Martelella sp. AMO21009]
MPFGRSIILLSMPSLSMSNIANPSDGRTGTRHRAVGERRAGRRRHPQGRHFGRFAKRRHSGRAAVAGRGIGFSKLASTGIEEAEINPLFVLANGQGVAAADSLVVLKD